MYPLAIVGNDCTADLTTLACHAAGFADIQRYCPTNTYHQPMVPIPANATRLLSALCPVPLHEIGREPQRAQIRLGRSAYLVSELPLGEFYRSRYGAAMLNCTEEDLREALFPVVKRSVAIPAATTISPEILNKIDDVHQLTLITSRLRHRQTQPKRMPPMCWYSLATELREPVQANITWLGANQRILQWSSPHQTHYLLITPSNLPFESKHWHPELHEAITHRGDAHYFDPEQPRIREYYYDGHRVFLGHACYQPHVVTPEHRWLGFEDAWVLSRMLENYEEDSADAVREYQRYRQARARRADQAAKRAFDSFMTSGRAQRLMNNVGTALSSRFLPEIAMHKQDWFHQHDCIRGFR